ncbi:TPA_asm: hypothetical protein [Armillaria mellea ambi-like virus 1]|uniref:Uncharacterized protein n=1 Tax=Armillaria mellea ambi-like virus 1 TaxID=2803968 RepID=A0A8D9UGV9_9VIRU|nr:TPA_asm: hypothetical protein [Armillaria mellea ambi-like virus 1]
MKVGTTISNVDNVRNVPGTFILTNPKDLDLLDKIKGLIHQPQKSINGTISYDALYAARYAYLAILLFQGTNQYPAFTSEIEDSSVPNRSLLKRQLYQGSNPTDLEGWKGSEDEGHVTKRLRSIAGGKGKDKETSNEPFDQFIPVNEVVSIAKPGDLKASVKFFGLPKDCPKMPGIVFEYFEGMNSPDGQYIRSWMSKHFFRCFGENPRENFARFKTGVVGFGSSREGMIVAHIMRCMEIALGAQALVYIMFDGQIYLGCVVLGARWALQTQNTWVEPDSAVEVANQLGLIKTHESSKADVEDWLKNHGVDDNTFSNAVELAERLAKAEFSGEGKELSEEKHYIDDLVRRLDFGTSPSGYGIDTLCGAIRDIGLKRAPPSQHVTFPKPDHYHLLAEPYAVILTRFGSRAPSFAIPKALVNIPIDPEAFPVESQEQKALTKLKLDAIERVVVAMKPFEVAAKDMKALFETPKVCTSGGERAAIYKYHTVKDGKKDRLIGDIVTMLKANPVEKKEASSSKKGKEKKASALEEVEMAMDFLNSLGDL